MFEIENTIFNENLDKWLSIKMEGLFVIIHDTSIIGYAETLEKAYSQSATKLGNVRTFIKEIKQSAEEKSAYDKMSLNDKVYFAAKESAVDFLNTISKNFYDQNHAPLYGTPVESLQSPNVREEIPVFSDVNINILQDLLFRFYQRNVQLLKEDSNGKV